ncbi:hypothetical protein ABKV19_011252 [Rosa sericea]
MDPPPLPPLPATAAATQHGYPDSLDSSPRSRNADSSWDAEPLPQVPGAKLRLMCSYGGHILPRPHDKSLCYVGGETRIVVADRHSSLSDLCSRLSRTLLNGRPFSLKYQLPTEDLDSLISVTTDEDLDNMVEEYDRTSSAASPLKPSSRLRLFLFFGKPETAASMGALLDDAKSESWFVDALNGSGLMPRNLSDSAATMDCLLTGGSDSCNDLEAAAVSQGDFFGDHNSGKPSVVVQEVHSISESAFVESNTSSSGSSSSSPCLSNLPPIRVRMDGNVAGVVQGQKQAGIEEQFAQISFAAAPTMAAAGGSSTNPMAVSSGGGETMNRINSEDDISGQNVPVGFRKPPLPMLLQPQHFKQGGGGGGGGYSLPSPDSVASDSSTASANSLSKPMYYQEQVQVAARDGRAPVSPNTTSDASDQGSRNQVQQVQDSGYSMPPQSDQQQQNQLQQQQQQQQQLLQQQQQQQQQQLQQQHLQQQQQQQQQFVHASAQYMNIQHPATGQVPVSPYYTMYAPPSQQQQLHHQIDHQQQYPVYLMPVAQSQQPYKMALQSTIADPTGVASTRITSQNPAAYKDSIPPIYPPKTASPAMPEMTQSVYQTSVTPTPQLVQIPSNQYQQQFVGYSQMHHPSQSIAVPSSATAPNYAYEYANPSHEQVYYTQHQAAPLPPQYQSMTPAAAAAAVAMSDESKQVAAYSAADQSHTQS